MIRTRRFIGIPFQKAGAQTLARDLPDMLRLAAQNLEDAIVEDGAMADLKLSRDEGAVSLEGNSSLGSYHITFMLEEKEFD